MPCTVVTTSPSATQRSRTVFYVSNSRSSRITWILYAAFLAYFLVRLSLMEKAAWRLNRQYGLPADYSIAWLFLWLVVIMAVALLLAFPPRLFQPRLEISSSNITFVPGWIGRHIIAEPVSRMTLPNNTGEILLAHKVLESAFSYQIAFLLDGGAETTFDLRLRLDFRRRQQLAAALAAGTGLPVRVVIKKRRQDGSFEEIVETTPLRFDWLGLPTAMFIAALPWVAGVVARFLTASPGKLVLAGLVGFVAQVGMYAFLARKHATHSKVRPASIGGILGLAWWFALYFIVAVVITANVFVKHR